MLIIYDKYVIFNSLVSSNFSLIVFFVRTQHNSSFQFHFFEKKKKKKIHPNSHTMDNCWLFFGMCDAEDPKDNSYDEWGSHIKWYVIRVSHACLISPQISPNCVRYNFISLLFFHVQISSQLVSQHLKDEYMSPSVRPHIKFSYIKYVITVHRVTAENNVELKNFYFFFFCFRCDGKFFVLCDFCETMNSSASSAWYA